MPHPSADLALLDAALHAVERLLVSADSGDEHSHPSGLELDASLPAEEAGDAARMTPAQSSLFICLNSAAALLDVSRSLLVGTDERQADELEREWKTLIALTKSASRSAYRATLIMAAQRNLATARGRQTGRDDSIAHPSADTWQ